jgi:hypothetical protein
MKRRIVVRLDTRVVVEVDESIDLNGDEIGWAVQDAAREEFRRVFRPDGGDFDFSWSPHLDAFTEEDK